MSHFMGAVQFARHIHELAFVMRQFDRLHLIRIDPRPHTMSMAAAKFFMKDDGAGLAGQTEFLFSRRNSLFKHLYSMARIWSLSLAIVVKRSAMLL